MDATCDHVRVDGKFFRLTSSQKWFAKGFTYGPFAGHSHLPDRLRLTEDFARMRQLGANAVRLYHPPTRWVLDDALANGLRVLVDVPWEKHRCFFEDWSGQQYALEQVRQTAKNLGDHPGLFAISVVNEIPSDVVRFYGHRRVARFVDDLIDVVKQEAPECLTTFGNYPPTEFLHPRYADFCCFNVYLEDTARLVAYLDRIQHLAGHVPLVLGEHGIDSLRHGEPAQASVLTEQIEQVFRHGLGGSFVFSYTDDWFTGGHPIIDWAFGLTRRDRSAKPSAASVRAVWAGTPEATSANLPKVSVVVCSYNGASTLAKCLESLMRLNYPDYEVILVDDGSLDNTREIAAQFPQFEYIRQSNLGLSVARNVGATKARGEVVAYLDSDCVADEDWLRYLVQAMEDQSVAAIGGPNIPPSSDGWIARCVAASPGGPSHVMLDDRRAEHVPGCNMAFRRDTLLALGGFDPQFRQAGDDVDMCWRWIDADGTIGYAPGAMVWHHRRSTIKAYLRQQRGYGRSEAMVRFKHPQRFSEFGRSRWKGIIYGDGAFGLSLAPPVIYHGRFGSALFKTMWRTNACGLWPDVMSLEWHACAVFFLLLATLFWPVAVVGYLMWCITLAASMVMAREAPLPRRAPFWCRPLVLLLHLLQPVVRGWHRYSYLFRRKKLPARFNSRTEVSHNGVVPATPHNLYWDSTNGRGREHLLESLVLAARESGWSGDFDNSWAEWDLKLTGDRWHDITVRSATEELGGDRRFTRVRCTVQPTCFSRVNALVTCIWTTAALVSTQTWAIVVALILSVLLVAATGISRRRCLWAVARLVREAARRAKLEPWEPIDPLASPSCGYEPATVPALPADVQLA